MELDKTVTEGDLFWQCKYCDFRKRCSSGFVLCNLKEKAEKEKAEEEKWSQFR